MSGTYPFPPDGWTVEEAQEWLRGVVDEGAVCPVCTQHAKVYRRKITSGAAHGLIQMYKLNWLGWTHVPSTAGLARLGGELARLAHWGLVEEATEPREDGGRAGWWKVTEDGEGFVLGSVRVPKYARIYDSRCLELIGERVGIEEALGSRFNYRELMAGM